MDLTEPQPLSELLRAFRARTPIGSVLRSAQWEAMPEALRARAFFSAGIVQVRWLEEGQERIDRLLTSVRDSEGGRMDRNLFILEMRDLGRALGLTPEDPALQGGLEDPTSERRLRLVVDTQLAMARGYGDYVSGQDPDILDEFPAQELVREREAREPRDWPARWQDDQWGAAELVQGRMVALKTDGVWTRISRFGQPWPPFDFNSGMGLAEIDRDEAEDLGLIGPEDVVEPSVDTFNDGLEASVRGMSARGREALRTIFGNQVVIDEDRVRWAAGGGGDGR